MASKIVKKLKIRQRIGINLTYTLALVFGVLVLCKIPSTFLGVIVTSYAVR